MVVGVLGIDDNCTEHFGFSKDKYIHIYIHTHKKRKRCVDIVTVNMWGKKKRLFLRNDIYGISRSSYREGC